MMDLPSPWLSATEEILERITLHGNRKLKDLVEFFWSVQYSVVVGAKWSPLRSVIIRVINKIRRLRSGSLIC